MGAMFLASALNRGSHPPEILKMACNTGGEMLLFRALARNMAPTYHDDSTLRFLNEVDPLCSLLFGNIMIASFSIVLIGNLNPVFSSLRMQQGIFCFVSGNLVKNKRFLCLLIFPDQKCTG